MLHILWFLLYLHCVVTYSENAPNGKTLVHIKHQHSTHTHTHTESTQMMLKIILVGVRQCYDEHAFINVSD